LKNYVKTHSFTDGDGGQNLPKRKKGKRLFRLVIIKGNYKTEKLKNVK